MATFYITEFTESGYRQGSSVSTYAGKQTDQTAITTSSSSQQSASFSAYTSVLRIKPVGGSVAVKFGSDPTATANSMHLSDGEVFDYFSGGVTDKVAVIDV